MLDLAVFWELMLFSTILTMTPGVNNVLVFLYTLHFGVKQALIFRLGVFLGFPGLAFLVVLFFNPITKQFPQIIDYMSYLGTALMFYIAYKVAFSLPNFEDGKTAKTAKPLGFWGAVFLQIINGKAWSMGFVATAFYTTPTEPVFTQAFTVFLGFLLPNIYCTVFWVMLALWGRDFLRQKHILQKVNYGFAILIIYSAVQGYF